MDSSAEPVDIFDRAKLSEIFLSSKMYASLPHFPLLAYAQKVVTTELGEHTVVRIYIGTADESMAPLPSGRLVAICQLKTAVSQVVIDCALSDDYIPLEPVWYSTYCSEMIDKYRGLLYSEIEQLVAQAHL